MNTTTTEKRPKPKPRLFGILATDRVAELPPGARACRECGRAVESPKRSAIVQRIPIGFETDPQTAAQRMMHVELVRCTDCAERRARAEALVAGFRLGPLYGGIAGDLVDAALSALDVIGIRGRHIEPLTRTPRDVRLLVLLLAHLGSAASWAAAIEQAPNRPRDLCAPSRWSHVTAEDRRQILADYKAAVHRQIERPMDFVPPGSSDGATLAGCLFCGRASLRVRESDAVDAWGREHAIDPAVLGGRARPERVRGHFCPACRAGIEVAGAIGEPAAALALLSAWGWERTRFGAQLRQGVVVPWVALRRDAEPNDEPWAHLDRASLERRLAASGAFRRKAAR